MNSTSKMYSCQNTSKQFAFRTSDFKSPLISEFQKAKIMHRVHNFKYLESVIKRQVLIYFMKIKNSLIYCVQIITIVGLTIYSV